MRAPSQEISDFLRSIGMHPEQTVPEAFIRTFLAEMDRGLAGQESSLKMIPTYLSAAGRPAEHERVIVIDAGGTNLRVALLEFRSGRAVVLREEKGPMPGSRGAIDADTFFSVLADRVLPFTSESDRIGFCFSYPTAMHPDGDGEIICLTKEVRVSGIEGRLIGCGLLEKLHEKGAQNHFSLVLLNDTAAGLLGGAVTLGLDPENGLAGLVLGTGFNTCYAERGTRITKLPGAKDMLINCESGNFSKTFRGQADELVDAESDDSGAYLLEKMASGAYIGRIVTKETELAAQRGLLSQAFAAPTMFETVELDALLRGGENRVTAMCTGSDRARLAELTESDFDRAAKLVCANVLALCLHCGGGVSPEKPFTVVAEGSTFYRSLLLRQKLDTYLRSIGELDDQRFVTFRRAEDATLAGAAFAALPR